MRKRKKEIVEDDNEKLMNFTKEKFLSLLRDRLVVDEELVSDEELLNWNMKSLDVDSLDYVETIMEVECAIAHRISYEDVEDFKCFQDVWDYIRECQENPQKLQ